MLQHAAAAAVAGHDRLTLVVGPAGTGKTTMLARRGRRPPPPGPDRCSVFPRPRKQHEPSNARPGWPATPSPNSSTNGPNPTGHPNLAGGSPAGTTLIVDEAGMLGTGNLHRLIELADRSALAAGAGR